MRKVGLVLLAMAMALVVVAVVSAASGVVISFLDDYDQPGYRVTAASVVDDGGCDMVTMMMVDAAGGITDIDSFCVDLLTGFGDDYTDWGSYESGYYPTESPVTYALFDTGMGDACYLDENSYACSDLLLSGAAACLAEEYHEISDIGAPAGALTPGVPFSVCVVPATASCSLPIPSGSVVGDMPFETQAYYSPGNVSPGVTIKPGTYIVVGQDSGESFYKIVLACQFIWVPKESMQPSYQPPQNGAPLPTRVVS